MTIIIRLFLILLFVGLIGCSPATFVGVEKTGDVQFKTIKRDYVELLRNTNPRFLDKVINTLKLPENLLGLITRNDRVIVQSVDRNYQSDNDLQLVIYRGLIANLLGRYITVLDRDENVLLVSFAESNGQLGNDWKIYSAKYLDSIIVFSKSTGIMSATKILGYRVLEFGQLSIPINDGKDFQRVGSVELEMRLIDANSSQILFTDVLRNTYYDFISAEEYNLISDLHYQFIYDALPLVQQVKYKDILLFPKEEQQLQGLATMEFKFRKGQKKSNVRIVQATTLRIVADFNIPSFDQRSDEFDEFYVYKLNLIDSFQQPLPKGKYGVYIDNVLVHQFTL
jgi:hypothetical protein